MVNGIEELIGAYQPGKIEEERNIEVVGEDRFRKLLQEYEWFLGTTYRGPDYTPWDRSRDHVKEILTPQEIHEFLLATSRYKKEETYGDTGIFITQLIQNSYLQGHNNFYLDTTDLPDIHDLGSLKGTPEQPLIITINGNVGRSLGSWHSQYIIIKVLGNVGDHCGMDSWNSEFNITGNVGANCGTRARYSAFTIGGNTGWGCGVDAQNSSFSVGNTEDWCGDESRDTKFRIEGTVGKHCGRGAEGSSFKSSNPETIEKLKRDVPKGNKIIQIYPNGKEKTVRGWWYDLLTAVGVYEHVEN